MSVGSSPARLRASFETIPSLDGLRAVAVTIVLVAHFGFYKYVPGGFGVTIFFFISGLLITRLLLAEQVSKGTVDIRNFYIRRALRLYPALLLAIAVGWVVYTAIGGQIQRQELLSSLFYYANYYSIWVGFGTASAPPNVEMHPYGVLWSLAVEEQYYLLFPWVFALLAARLRRFTLAVGIALVACLLWRIVLSAVLEAGEYRIYAGTDTRIDSILWGALTALILQGPNGERFMAFCRRTWVLALSVAILLFCLLYRDAFFRETFRYSLQGLALAPIVAAVCFSDRLPLVRRLLNSQPARLMGAWSYSLYLFHPSAVMLAEYVTQTKYVEGFRAFTAEWYFIAIGLTFALSLASHYAIERPFLSLRRRFGSHGSAAPKKTMSIEINATPRARAER